MSIPRIVIVGGGFGGVYTARYLKRLTNAGRAEVTLINRANYFLFTPLLHEVATGSLSGHSVTEPIREIFRRSRIHFLQAEVKTIDTDKKLIGTSAGKISYDYLVVSTGAETNYYETSGAEKYTYTLKNLADAIELRRRIIQSCEQHKTKFIVVGGGATGVELAAELIEFLLDTLFPYYQETGLKREELGVTLVTADSELIPQFPIELRQTAHETLTRKGVEIKTSARVVGIDATGLKLADGTSLESETIIWVAGVKPVTPMLSEIAGDPHGRLRIDEYLRVEGLGNTFALGDNAGTLPMLAQVAVQEARTVAANIVATIKRKPLHSFVYREKGLLISLGQWFATGRIFGRIYHGRLTWWLWRTIYLFNFLSWRKRLKIAAEWTINIFSPRDISAF